MNYQEFWYGNEIWCKKKEKKNLSEFVIIPSIIFISKSLSFTNYEAWPPYRYLYSLFLALETINFGRNLDQVNNLTAQDHN